MLTFIYNLLPNIDLNGLVTNYYEMFEDTKGQTMIYKTLQRKLKIETHEPH